MTMNTSMRIFWIRCRLGEVTGDLGYLIFEDSSAGISRTLRCLIWPGFNRISWMRLCTYVVRRTSEPKRRVAVGHTNSFCDDECLKLGLSVTLRRAPRRDRA